MKILIVVHYFLPHIGGMEKVVEKQAKSLVTYGHEVTIVTCRPSKAAPLEEVRDGYRIVRLRAINGIEQKFGVTFPLVGFWEIGRFMKLVREHDIVHIHDVFYTTSHLAWLACILERKHFYLTQHVAMVAHPSLLVMLVQRIMYATFGKAMFTRARKLIAYNHIVRSFLLSHGAREVNVLMQYNGIETDYFAPLSVQEKRVLREKYNLPLEKPIVLFVGRLVPKKGYNIVYNAQSSDYFTLIVGDGVHASEIVSNENTRLFGPATPQQLRDLYGLSDVFAFPAEGEIFTLVMQEAMASGLPTILADDPGYESYEFSREYIKLVPRKSSALQSAVLEILANDTQKKEMANYARDFATENFNWHKNYAREYALYELDLGK